MLRPPNPLEKSKRPNKKLLPKNFPPSQKKTKNELSSREIRKFQGLRRKFYCSTGILLPPKSLPNKSCPPVPVQTSTAQISVFL